LLEKVTLPVLGSWWKNLFVSSEPAKKHNPTWQRENQQQKMTYHPGQSSSSSCYCQSCWEAMAEAMF
jgi:hypothetical protein